MTLSDRMSKFWDKFRIAALFIFCFAVLLNLNTDATDESLLAKSRSSSSVGYESASAILTIVSDTGKGETRYGMPCYGHTFLVIENTAEDILDFCGRQIEPSENLTFGWWAISSHGGAWFGIESNYIEAYGRYPDRVALSREIDGEGISRLADYILTHDLYTPFENCAVRAVAAFNWALPEVRQLNVGYFTTPAEVVDAIISHGGSHEAAMDIDFTEQMPSCGFGEEIEFYNFAVKKGAK